jgi:hypothetical protein
MNTVYSLVVSPIANRPLNVYKQGLECAFLLITFTHTSSYILFALPLLLCLLSVMMLHSTLQSSGNKHMWVGMEGLGGWNDFDVNMDIEA